MRLTDFIKAQDRSTVEDGRITFKILLPMKFGSKWVFYCCAGETLEKLCGWVKFIKMDVILNDNVKVEQDKMRNDGKISFSYVFDLTDIPDGFDWFNN